MSRDLLYPYEKMLRLLLAQGCPNCGHDVEVTGSWLVCERCRVYWKLPRKPKIKKG